MLEGVGGVIGAGEDGLLLLGLDGRSRVGTGGGEWGLVGERTPQRRRGVHARNGQAPRTES